MSPAKISAEISEALLRRYEQERDKRLRQDGTAQYIDVRSKDIQYLAKDPWVNYSEPQIKDSPLKNGDSIKFLISGAGLNGLHTAVRLIEAGTSKKDVVLVDIAGGFGGTWYWNRYPGLMCDVEGYCYVPFLEETGYSPKHKYSYGAEIRHQIERSAAHFGVQGQFCTKIDSKVWDNDKKLWVVAMTRTVGNPPKSETLTVNAEFIIMAGGVLTIPKIPRLPGWDSFRSKKHVFHSSRWDYKYTGGTQEKPDLVNLKGKRVAIIGTGATAVQIVPELAKWADHVYVIQRTPTYIGARNQTPTDPEHWTGITSEKGWQNKRRINFNAYISNGPSGYGPDLVNDGWTDTPASSAMLGTKGKIITPDRVQQHIKELHELDIARTELVRKRVDDIVEDKDVAEKLKPWFNSWCKRPSFHDDYLATFNKSNVTLVDTDGRGPDGFSEKGILFDGKEYEIDVVVLATGFSPSYTMDPAEKLGAVIKGRNGITMKDYWNDPSSGTLLGLAMPGFPNFFGFLGRGAAASWNMSSVFDMQAKLTANIISQAQNQAKPNERVIIEPSEEGERWWGQEVAKRATWFSAVPGCTPSYYNNEGASSMNKEPLTEEQQYNEAKKAMWGGGPVEYQEIIEDYAAQGDLKGFLVEFKSEE